MTLRDSFSEARLAEVYPVTAHRIRQLAAMLDFDLRVTQGLRTWPQQDALYQQGRTIPGAPCVHNGVTFPVGSCPEHPLGSPVTKAKAGQSGHNFGYPADVAPIINGVIDWNGKDEKWAAILAKAPTCGLAEGATWRTFPDEPHLYPEELPADPDDQMRADFAGGGIRAVWEEFDSRLSQSKNGGS